jgi:hypothetical protein
MGMEASLSSVSTPIVKACNFLSLFFARSLVGICFPPSISLCFLLAQEEETGASDAGVKGRKQERR